jgi:hypothetical protein
MSPSEQAGTSEDGASLAMGRAHERPARAPTPAGERAALKFVGRVAQLDLEELSDVLAIWRQTMRDDPDAWFTAEAAVGSAVVASGRRDEQRGLLIHVADAFTHLVWYGGRRGRALGAPAPELRVRASESSGQYLATLAMLAVLVRDHLDAATFALLYAPFAPHIPLSGLGPE